TKSSSDTLITPPTVTSTRLTTFAKGKQPVKASKAKSLTVLSEVAMNDDDDDVDEGSDDQDDDDDDDDNQDDDNQDNDDQDEGDDCNAPLRKEDVMS
nr:hypothetical protein [Tanacetum cinerariifolium]